MSQVVSTPLWCRLLLKRMLGARVFTQELVVVEPEVLEVHQAAELSRDDARKSVALELQLLEGRQES